MKKRYKIVVTEWSEEERITARQWAKGGPDGKDSPDDEYGYTKQIPEIRRVEREIYMQNTDQLDIVAVINAVNT